MLDKTIEKLIIKFITKSISAAELEMLSKWVDHKANEKVFKEFIKINYALDYNLSRFNTEKAKLLFLSSIDDEIKDKKVINLLNSWKYVAAAIIFLAISLPFVLKKTDLEFTKTPIISQEPILPGSNKAILTLEDGQHVTLEKGKKYVSSQVNSNGENLIYSNSKPPNNTVKIAYNFLTIPRGGQFFVKLPDNTKVWLNSESKLKYPIHFIEGEARKVELIYGEAYFDVSSSTDHNGAKFKVKTRTQDLTVLGTQFNIKSYLDQEDITTTLVEGNIEITNGVNTKLLKPNQQSHINLKNEIIEIHNIDVYDAISWKNGFFNFKNMYLSDIMKVLSRWYNIEVVFEDIELKNGRYGGAFSRNQSLEEILEIIHETNDIVFKIDDNKVIIK